MNSNRNLLSEIGKIYVSRFSKCRVYYSGKIGLGTTWEYKGGGEQFKVWITPEQAQILSRLQERFSIEGVINGYSKPDEYEEAILNSLPDVLINRYKDRVEISSSAQIALYDLIE